MTNDQLILHDVSSEMHKAEILGTAVAYPEMGRELAEAIYGARSCRAVSPLSANDEILSPQRILRIESATSNGDRGSHSRQRCSDVFDSGKHGAGRPGSDFTAMVIAGLAGNAQSAADTF